MTDQQRARAQFDAWAKSANKTAHGFNRVEDMWDAWQAASAVLRAAPEGVKDRPGIDGCTESNCKRCRTHPDHRGDMEHAGIGWRPDGPQEASDA